ncbi:MAG: TRAP transporter small permease [Moorellales bacterium]
MAVTVVAILLRFIKIGFPGSYDLTEMFTVAAVGFALFRATLEKGHVTMTLLVERLPRRFQIISERFAWLVTLGVWALVAWAALDIALERGLGERTVGVSIPCLPFRVLWLCGLLLLCVAALVNFIESIRVKGGHDE